MCILLYIPLGFNSLLILWHNYNIIHTTCKPSVFSFFMVYLWTCTLFTHPHALWLYDPKRCVTLKRPYLKCSVSLKCPYLKRSVSLKRPYLKRSVSLKRPYLKRCVSLNRPYLNRCVSLKRPSRLSVLLCLQFVTVCRTMWHSFCQLIFLNWGQRTEDPVHFLVMTS